MAAALVSAVLPSEFIMVRLVFKLATAACCVTMATTKNTQRKRMRFSELYLNKYVNQQKTV